MSISCAAARLEDANGPLGGPNGYWQVCKSGDKYQGKDRVRGIYTTTYGTAHEAAINLAQKKVDVLQQEQIDGVGKDLMKLIILACPAVRWSPIA